MVHNPAESHGSCTEQYPCPYFHDGRITTIEYRVEDSLHPDTFACLLAKGFRRVGRIFYRNICSGCTACKPIRIDVENFSLAKSARRTLGKNRDIRITIACPPSVTPEKHALYKRYVTAKHGEPSPAPDCSMPVVYGMHYGYDHIIEMDYFHRGSLVGVGIVDEGSDSLSSNYFYYDTDYLQRRPGIFSILQEILLANRMGKKYYYLGFYIADNPSMSYKKDFRPNQILEGDTWIEFAF